MADRFILPPRGAGALFGSGDLLSDVVEGLLDAVGADKQDAIEVVKGIKAGVEIARGTFLIAAEFGKSALGEASEASRKKLERWIAEEEWRNRGLAWNGWLSLIMWAPPMGMDP